MTFAAKILTTLTGLILAISAAAQERIIEWVEFASVSDTTKIALGYPTPIPVDTPLPFDGFRSYAGLNARHQDLAATSDMVHAVDIGATHAGRTIWAYRLGDADLLTPFGLPEPATLTNGGIHAREWQSPETLTGIMELMVEQQDDHHFYRYLLDNVNMILIPVLNVDGFLQTQRFPNLSWMGTSPDDPDSPRDGRMRRKNMLTVDEVLTSKGDHLFGVDLNRNHPPYWSASPGNSSPSPDSILHHGAGPHSEPESRALAASALLGPASELRLFTDVHSFSRVHLWPRNLNDRLANQSVRTMRLFSDHHQALPGGNWYAFDGLPHSGVINNGIGLTTEYFLETYEIPTWTLEIEPTGGQPFFGTPGCGADYGGLARNCHDGFILPESEIRRVRENLAQSFAAVYYRQAGPPSITAARFIDKATGAVVLDAEWDRVDDATRVLHLNQLQALQLGRDYGFWLSFDKPMRWRSDGQVTVFPGQSASTLDVMGSLEVDSNPLTVVFGDQAWLNTPGGAPSGYDRYEDDALSINFQLPLDELNAQTVVGTVEAILSNTTTDMVGLRIDSDPSTVATWSGGAWSGYEDIFGMLTDIGGIDDSVNVQVTSDDLGDPFVLEPGIASAWFDLEHDGEGFIIEILADGRALLYWFTYNDAQEQDWYIGNGVIDGNRIFFEQLLRVEGGVFGPGFDPELVTETPVGTAEFIWSGCNSGSMDWRIGHRHGRQQLVRITRLLGLECGIEPGPPVPEQAVLSGSWFDPTHDGEGFTVEMLPDNRVVVYWFSFGPNGERRWFFALGEYRDGKLVFNEVFTTSGGIFGDDFDPETVELLPWGTLELDIGCEGGTASYSSTEDGFGSGILDVIRLSSMAGLGCAP